MNYYFDTEFLEGTQRKYFLGIPYSNIPNTIDLISIGIVSEDGREYYAVSKDFNLKEAWNRWQDDNSGYHTRKTYWIRDNVLKPIYEELLQRDGLSIKESKTAVFIFSMFKFYINKYGKTNKQIAEEIKNFVHYSNHVNIDKGITEEEANPKFYAYYADYDWVVFCWLFGKMIDLPKGFPMYTIDLKQILDSKYMYQKDKYGGEALLQEWLQDVKKSPNYPKQENKHNALDDAKWNKKLHKFLKIL